MNLNRIQQVGFIYSAIVTALLMAANFPVLFYQTAPWAIPMVGGFLMIFPMWAVMIYYLNKIHGDTLKSEDIQRLPFFERIKWLMNHPPQWLFILTCLFYLYGTYCVFLWFTGATADPSFVEGRYQSVSHGQVTYYTEAEYLVAHRNNILAETGLPLMFAVFAFAVFFPKKGIE